VLSGFRDFLEEQPIYQGYLFLLEGMEKELLIQWNIKQTQGLDALFNHHNRWLGDELRKKDSIFDLWTRLCIQLWNECDPASGIYHPSVWRSYVLKSLGNQNTWGSLAMGLQTDQQGLIMKKIAQVMKLLLNADPHHQILSFLNLLELGVNDRPEICESGTIPEDLVGKQIPPFMVNSLLPAISNDQWDEVPDLLRQYWQEKESNTDE
ncbi:MAG: hypothetical protein GY786_12675, partial [Proteobacteria bacterium]|nr:hypothetical protein [Pseudomonadota bacterium]